MKNHEESLKNHVASILDPYYEARNRLNNKEVGDPVLRCKYITGIPFWHSGFMDGGDLDGSQPRGAIDSGGSSSGGGTSDPGGTYVSGGGSADPYSYSPNTYDNPVYDDPNYINSLKGLMFGII